LFELSNALGKKNCAQALKTFDAIIDRGKDIKQLTKDLVGHFRDLMVMKVGGKTLGRLLDYPVSVKEMYLSQSKQFSLAEILKAIDLFIEAQDVARVTEMFRTPLEIAFAKITYRDVREAPIPEEQKGAAQNKEDAHAKVRVAHRKEEASHKVSPIGILRSKKGQINASSDEVREVKNGDIPVAINLDIVKREWSAMTYALSRKKMSLATYLQEGFPVAVEGEKIIIAFKPEGEFYKDSLGNSEYVLLVETIFSEHLGQKVIIRYKIEDNLKVRHEEDEPGVKAVLDAFNGKIVNKWHDE